MIITTKTTVAFKLPNEYEKAMKLKKEHQDWTETLDTNIWRYENVQTYFTVDMEIDKLSEIGGDTE